MTDLFGPRARRIAGIALLVLGTLAMVGTPWTVLLGEGAHGRPPSSHLGAPAQPSVTGLNYTTTRVFYNSSVDGFALSYDSKAARCAGSSGRVSRNTTTLYRPRNS